MSDIKDVNPIQVISSHCLSISIFRTIGVIGDSLSSGEHESFSKEEGKHFHDYYEYSWGQFIARRCGSTVYNFSKGGLQCKTFFEYIKNNNPFTEEKRCQAYIIALGVNDMTHINETYDGFGSFDDVDWENEDNNKNTFIGWYVKIIQKLRKFSPKCRIFVMDMPRGVLQDESTAKKYDDVRDFLIALVDKFEFMYLLDLRKYAPEYDREFMKKYYCGTHMSALGYKFTADMVMSYISYIIDNNPQDFTQVGFIDKDVHNELEKW